MIRYLILFNPMCHLLQLTDIPGPQIRETHFSRARNNKTGIIHQDVSVSKAPYSHHQLQASLNLNTVDITSELQRAHWGRASFDVFQCPGDLLHFCSFTVVLGDKRSGPLGPCVGPGDVAGSLVMVL